MILSKTFADLKGRNGLKGIKKIDLKIVNIYNSNKYKHKYIFLNI